MTTEEKIENPLPPTDVEVFLKNLPKYVDSFAKKYNDPKTARDLAINLAREEVGHLAELGLCRMTTMCRDGRPLALTSATASPGPLAIGNGANRQGAMVAQFESQQVTKIQGL